MTNELKELRERIAYHDNLYYNQGKSEITDVEYDALKAKYFLFGGEDLVVPDKAVTNKRFKHWQPLLSLDKVTSEDELRKRLKQLAPGCIEPKIDGLTMALYPDTKFITRGTGGIEGDDRSHIARAMTNMQCVHPEFPVRMEVYLDVIAFDAINRRRAKQDLPLYENARNASAGIVSSDHGNYAKELSYFAYELVGDTRRHSEQLKALQEGGFVVIPSFPYTEETVDQAMEMILNFDRNSLPYQIDGMVVKSDIPNARAVWGETGHHVKSQFAWKWGVDSEWTQLTSVTWETGRTGQVTPVGHFEPVSLYGSEVAKATLHNIAYIEERNIRPGCRVEVTKANEIIPAVLNAEGGEGSFEAPTHCPSCGTAIERVKDQLFCRNTASCGTMFLNQLKHMVSRKALDIIGLSESTLQKMIDANLLPEKYSLFSLAQEQIVALPRMGEKSATNLYEAIQGAIIAPGMSRVIYAAGIPLVGNTVSSALASKYVSLEALKADVQDFGATAISQISGIGTEIASAVANNIDAIMEMGSHMKSIQSEREAAPQKKANAMTFVITGTLSRPRAEIEADIKAAGHAVTGSVTGNTSFVVCNNIDSSSSKMKKALQLGVKVITEQGLEALL